jgi:hypothetical protein
MELLKNIVVVLEALAAIGIFIVLAKIWKQNSNR